MPELRQCPMHPVLRASQRATPLPQNRVSGRSERPLVQDRHLAQANPGLGVLPRAQQRRAHPR